MNPLRLGYHSLQRAAFSPPQLRAGLAARRPARAAAFFHAARRRAQTSRPERYGTAKEPPPHLQEVTTSEGAEDGVKGAGPAEQTQQVPDAAGPPSSAEQKADGEPGAKADVIALPSPTPKEGAAATDPPAAPEGVLSVSKQEDSSSSNLPQLHPPPYMHHFDTWTLVRDLEKGGFTEEQAVTIMKAVRLLLTKNMDLARDALVSKSNVENEVYLFRAASSELKTEIKNSRKAEADTWRSERATVQSEVDILGQNMTQQLSVIKDELKGLFDDRKMAVRMEQKQLEAKIQELNYKISVALNSDARGSVEGMRWFLTRRAAMALAISSLMVLGTLNYSRIATAAQEAERRRLETEHVAAENLTQAVAKGGAQRLAEEVVLAPEGASGG